MQLAVEQHCSHVGMSDSAMHGGEDLLTAEQGHLSRESQQGHATCKHTVELCCCWHTEVHPRGRLLKCKAASTSLPKQQGWGS